MTKFNPKNKKHLTYGECLDPAMLITDQEDADQYLADYIAFIQERSGVELERAEWLAKNNLGYYAGYYNDKVRERVERLFNCSHPIFGSIVMKGAPTAEEAFEAGMKIGAELKKNK